MTRHKLPRVLVPLAMVAGACSAGPGTAPSATTTVTASSSAGDGTDPAGSIAGDWTGRIEIPGAPLAVGVDRSDLAMLRLFERRAVNEAEVEIARE